MSTRGPYAKGVAKRREILDAALRVIGEHGYTGATVKQIADEVGLSQNGLLHYFGSKDELLVEVLRRRDERDTFTYSDDDASGEHPIETLSGAGAPDFGQMRAGVGALVRNNVDVYGLVHLFVRLTADGSEPGHAAHAFFRERYGYLRKHGAEWVSTMQDSGSIRRDADPAQVAVMLFALIDGLQNQWIYEESVDMAAHVEAFFDLLRPVD